MDFEAFESKLRQLLNDALRRAPETLGPQLRAAVGEQADGAPPSSGLLELLLEPDSALEGLVERYLRRRIRPARRTAAGLPECADLLHSLSELFEQRLDDARLAYETLLLLLELEVVLDATAARRLGRLAAAADRSAQLERSARQHLEAASEPTRQLELCLQLARWSFEQWQQPSRALAYLFRANALFPDHISVLRLMARCQRATGRHEEAEKTLRAALPLAVSNAVQAAILAELGEVLEHHRREPVEALTCYRGALQADPFTPTALAGLRRISGRKQRG